MSSRRLDEIRKKIKKVRERKDRLKAQTVYPSPRYDEVFVRGTEWLDSLAVDIEEDWLIIGEDLEAAIEKLDDYLAPENALKINSDGSFTIADEVFFKQDSMFQKILELSKEFVKQEKKITQWRKNE